MVDGARSVLNDLLADVYIFTDHMTGPEAGQSPGYGLMLVAETTTGCFINAECTANAALKVSMHSAACPLFAVEFALPLVLMSHCGVTFVVDLFSLLTCENTCQFQPVSILCHACYT